MGKHKTLTPTQKVVADVYVETGNKSKAGIKARPDLAPESARVYADRQLRSDTVQDYLKSRAMRSAENLAKIADSGHHDSVTLRANQDILDRAGYKPQETVNTPHTPVNGTNQQAHLKQLLQALEAGDTVALERIVLNPEQ